MKMKYFVLVTLAILLASCKSSGLPKGSAERLNSSALYDPPTITLVDGQLYHFEEGSLAGRGQKFHSHYSYLRALTVGE